MQAIKTKYLPATNTKPSRIKAECEAGSTTISYDHSLNDYDLHVKAAYLLLKKLRWEPTKLYTGQLKNNDYVHIMGSPCETYLDVQNLPEFLKEQA